MNQKEELMKLNDGVLPEEYIDLILKQNIRYLCLTSMHLCMYYSFIWSETIEGVRFWNDVCLYVRGLNSELPPIPKPTNHVCSEGAVVAL